MCERAFLKVRMCHCTFRGTKVEKAFCLYRGKVSHCEADTKKSQGEILVLVNQIVAVTKSRI